MDVSRGTVAQALVGPLIVVQLEIVIQAGRQGRHRLIPLEVNVLVLHRPPQPLDEDVVEHPRPIGQ